MSKLPELDERTLKALAQVPDSLADIARLIGEDVAALAALHGHEYTQRLTALAKRLHLAHVGLGGICPVVGTVLYARLEQKATEN